MFFFPILDDEDEPHSQERTPTIRPVSPPPVDTPDPSPPRSSPPQRERNLTNDEARLQKALSPKFALTVLSPLPSPPADSPTSPLPNLPSFLHTPPRHSTSTTIKPEFQTPPLPDGLPALPGPPSSSSEGDQSEEEPKRNWLNGNAPPDITAMKTPRPPGAWSVTPAAEKVLEHLHPAHSQTPSPDNGDKQVENGLVTPIASMSRGSTFLLPTPAPPGAWAATPAGRKSILKVHFDTENPAPEETSSEEVAHPSNFLAPRKRTNGHVPEQSQETSEDLSGGEQLIPDPIEPPKPVQGVHTPVGSPSKNTPKTPNIRVLDAYGREQGVNGSPRRKKPIPSIDSPNKSAVRIVDAMGREVGGGDLSSERSDTEFIPPANRGEALVRVRQGLSDLAQGLDNMARY